MRKLHLFFSRLVLWKRIFSLRSIVIRSILLLKQVNCNVRGRLRHFMHSQLKLLGIFSRRLNCLWNKWSIRFVIPLQSRSHSLGEIRPISWMLPCLTSIFINIVQLKHVLFFIWRLNRVVKEVLVVSKLGYF